MALLQKKPQIMSALPLYNIGAEKTIALIGLGNIGKKYENTRHNVGFMALDRFAELNDFPKWEPSKKLHADMTKSLLGNANVLLVKPATLMNNSGKSVTAALRYNSIDITDCIVIYDDIDITFGKLKTQIGGSSAGHNGIKSIMQQAGHEFGRVRVGIGPKDPPEIDSADFVLQRFTKPQRQNLDMITKEISAILTETIFGGGSLPAETRNALLD